MLLFSSAGAQISPGPLSRAHESLDGPTKCASCHVVGGGRGARFRCLDCHSEIAKRVSAGRGLHASFLRQATSETCGTCHSEHNGEKFSLVKWNPAPGRFDHSKAGYTLEGKHATLSCERCHNPARILPAERPAIVVKDPSRTFLGLPRDCQGCHSDVHRGQLGSDCARCHNAQAWRPALGFDHGRTRFALTGAHAQLSCQKCHAPLGEPGAMKFTGLTFQGCESCHRDPHRASFNASCQSCHNTASWRRVTMAVAFDHAKTDFPLRGRHAALGCVQCHAGGDFKRPLAFQRCQDCHRPDPHSGQFAKRAGGGDCASCHTQDAFKPARFGLQEHASSAYPLEGKHAALACAKCHVPAGKVTLYRMKFAACVDCHKDEHRGQFAAAPHFNRCQDCHSLNGYHPSTFTLARHKTSSFPLTGGHAAVACDDCHKPQPQLLPAKVAMFRFQDNACSSCHADPHRGQFREVTTALKEAGAAGCQGCHSTGTWRDLSGFDHSRTRFALLGAHRAVNCAGCHQSPRLEPGLKNVVFRNAPHQCESCHEDAHAGQFAVGGATGCTDCHNSTKWRPSLFDHERAAFSLQGAHREVPCASCHTSRRLVEGRQVVFYRPTAKECAACHGAVVSKQGG